MAARTERAECELVGEPSLDLRDPLGHAQDSHRDGTGRVMQVSDADSLEVDPGNRDQLRVWDGDEGAYFAAHADRFNRGVALHHRRLLDAAAIGTSDRVLDVGCGTGQATRDAARAAPEGHVLGVDLSAVMLDYARRRAAAERLGNVAFEQADAQIHPFRADAFDVVISRFGCMFFAGLRAAFANIVRAVRPGGRVVLLTWQARDRNEWYSLPGVLAAGRAAADAAP